MFVGSITDERHALVFTKTHCLIMDNDVPNHPVAVGHKDTKEWIVQIHSLASHDSYQWRLTHLDFQN